MFSNPGEQRLLISRLIRSGMTAGMNYRERRRIMVVNIAGLAGGACALLFFCANFLTGYFPLYWLDLITAAACFSMPFFQRRQLSRYPPAAALLICMLCCAYSAYIYHNHTEYFLLLFMGVSFAIWDERRLTVPLAVLNAALFFLVQTLDRPAAALSVPGWNKAVVLAMVLSLYFYFLYYFKQQNASYQERIEQQNLNKEKMISVIAHDIRAPIAGVYTSLALLKEGHLERAEFDDLTSRLLSQVGNLQVNIGELLEWSKSQLNELKPRREVFRLADILPPVMGMLRFQLDAKQVSVDSSGLQQLSVAADRGQTEVILRNLLSNAVKFSYRGAEVSLSAEQAGDMAVITVRDSGLGISPENLKKLFDPAELLTTYGTDNEKGNGLGLKLCREFARQNGGELEISSEQGRGTTCVVRLPAPGSAAAPSL